MKLLRVISVTKSDLIIGTALCMAVIVLIAGSRISRLTNSKAISSDEPVDIYLSEPVGLESLSEILADSGVINDKEEVIWAGKLLGWRSFRQGYYQVEGTYSYDVFLSRIARGIQDPVKVIILPGLTKERLISSLSQQLQFDSVAIKNTLSDSSFLAEEEISPDELLGRMYPNTYSLYWTSTPETVIRRILREFREAVYNRYKERMEELDMTVNEVLALASIIEWEANKNEEKATVSGLYWNRLKRGMLLQADPTVNFAVNERRRLLYEDYRMAHPYNTYIHKGLPPGPITNPSGSSIEAALYPEDHNYLYMVASPEGTHVFTETFDEHKKESAKWRQWIREQYRIKREREAAVARGSDVSS